MRPSRDNALWAAGGGIFLVLAAIAEAFAGFDIPPVSGTTGVPDTQLLSQPRKLQLEVFINDKPVHYVEPFVWNPGGRLSARRSDLEEVGLKIPGEGAPAQTIYLDELQGVRFRYDEAKQYIYFYVGDEHRLAKVYDARGRFSERVPPRADFGGLLNYSIFAASNKDKSSGLSFSGANVSLDGRIFSSFGTLTQTGIVGTTTAKDVNALRLDTTFTHSDPDAVMTYRAGDFISGGLPWTRPIRMGGLQAQRDFALRSDIVTLPLPVVAGTTAVPSTVDVFINNLKTYSQDVGAGPYSITNLPLLAAAGSARVVVRDAAGREVETTVSLFSSSTLLAKGLSDFSLEAGFARLSYGSQSDDYNAKPIASGSLRYGLTDWLTVEGHFEGGAGLENGGIGAVTGFGEFGTLSAAASFSNARIGTSQLPSDSTLSGAVGRALSGTGAQLYGSYSISLSGFTLEVGSQRTFGTYNDLASATVRLRSQSLLNQVTNYLGIYGSGSLLPPKELDRVSIGIPLPIEQSSLSLGFINLKGGDDRRSRILTASYSQQLPYRATFFVTAFTDFADRKSKGFFAGLSLPITDTVTGSAGVGSGSNGGQNFSVDLQKSLAQEPGSYGWHIRDTEGAQFSRSASAAYRASIAKLSGTVQQTNSGLNGSTQIDGSIAAMGGGVFLGNRVEDSFAVVDAGAPGVKVLQDNRPVGETGSSGKLLVPNLRSFQNNKISIDPHNLPVTADATNTQEVVAPTYRSGVYVNFGVSANPQAAIVVLTGPDGKPLPTGATGHLEGSANAFVVGYDGRAYIRGLSAQNTAIIDLGDRECRASFPYAPKPGRQTFIGATLCQ